MFPEARRTTSVNVPVRSARTSPKPDARTSHDLLRSYRRPQNQPHPSLALRAAKVYKDIEVSLAWSTHAGLPLSLLEVFTPTLTLKTPITWPSAQVASCNYVCKI